MTKTLEERVLDVISCNKGIFKSSVFPINTLNTCLELLADQQARIRELEAEPTEEEVDHAASEIWNFAQQLDDLDDIRLDPTRDDCIGMAKAALEAYRKVRIGEESGE